MKLPQTCTWSLPLPHPSQTNQSPRPFDISSKYISCPLIFLTVRLFHLSLTLVVNSYLHPKPTCFFSRLAKSWLSQQRTSSWLNPNLHIIKGQSFSSEPELLSYTHSEFAGLKNLGLMNAYSLMFTFIEATEFWSDLLRSSN